MSEKDKSGKMQVLKNYSLAITAVCLILFAVIAGYQIDDGHNWGDDFGLYLQMADNIKNGAPLNFLNTGIPAPPGFPFLIAVWSWVFDDSFATLKWINVFSWCVATLAVTQLARVSLGCAGMLFVLAMLMFTPGYYFSQNSILTDLPFTATASLSMFFAYCYLHASTDARARNAMLLLVCMAISIMIRTPAIALIISIFISMFVGIFIRHKKINKEFLVEFAPILSACAFSFFLYFITSGSATIQYAKIVNSGGIVDLSDIALKFYSHMYKLLENMHVMFFGFPVRLFASVLALIVMILGMVLYFRRTSDVTLPVFAFIYTGMIAVAPWNGGFRYLMPLIAPAYVFVAAFLVSLISYRAERPILKFASILAGIVPPFIILALMIQGARGAYHYKDDQTSDSDTTSMLSFIADMTGPDDVVCSPKPRAVMYFIKRRGCALPSGMNSGKVLMKYLGGADPAAVVVFSFIKDAPGDGVFAGSDYNKAFQNEKYVVYLRDEN